MVKIIISEIVPPPIGTAVTNKFAINATIIICPIPAFVPNKHTKNIILNTEPIIEPSLWKLVPSGIIVSAISGETPIFLAAVTFAGIDAAEEHVASDVIVAGIIFFQKTIIPFFPPAINAYIDTMCLESNATMEYLKQYKEYVNNLIIAIQNRTIRNSNGAVMGLIRGISYYDELCVDDTFWQLVTDADNYYCNECQSF